MDIYQKCAYEDVGLVYIPIVKCFIKIIYIFFFLVINILKNHTVSCIPWYSMWWNILNKKELLSLCSRLILKDVEDCNAELLGPPNLQ